MIFFWALVAYISCLALISFCGWADSEIAALRKRDEFRAIEWMPVHGLKGVRLSFKSEGGVGKEKISLGVDLGGEMVAFLNWDLGERAI